MTRILLATPTLVALAIAAASPAFAQDALDTAAANMDTAALNRDRVTIALGAANVPSYEGSDRSVWIPFAAVQGSVSGYAFSSRGQRLYLDVIRNAPGPVVDFQLGPVSGFNRDRVRRKGIKDPQVEALGTRDMAIELGGYVGLGKTGVVTSDYDRINASVSYLRDVNGAHDSYTITPMLDYGTPLSPRAYVGISAEANYVGGKYADYYFSVDPAGALASGLPVFNAGAGWKNWSLSGFATHSLTGDLLHGLGVFGGVRYSRLLNDAKDSPVTRIAGDRGQWAGAVGLTYTF